VDEKPPLVGRQGRKVDVGTQHVQLIGRA
jgi:hypothetical protein